MRFGDVEIPAEIVDAHAAGRLVIFVGAGASMGPPSNLPSFSDLTKRVRDESELTDVIGDLANESLDEVMGDIEEKHEVDVHLRVAMHTGRRSSLPNPLHRAIADLGRCRDLRVVTTNYDTHLSTTLGPGISTYFSPALPMGSEFTGLVYLHGCVTQPAEQLVVTAGDFGRAYLTEAWAARFLERMFATYKTLFIGYSYNDVIMKYLARGLGPQAQRRYIFTHEPTSAMWKQLNITPIEYSSANSHRALTVAVQRWAAHAAGGLFDKQRQIESIIDSRRPAQLSAEESSFLQSVVSDETAAQFFCRHASGLDWLTWVSDLAAFRSLFDPADKAPSPQWHLANWFARTYVTDELSSHALAVIRRFGGRCSPQLWDALARRLIAAPKTGGFGVVYRPWLPLLLAGNPPEQSVIFLDLLLANCALPADTAPALALLSFLTKPRVVDRVSVPGTLVSQVRLRGDAHRLHETWAEVFKPNLQLVGREILPIIDQNLRRAQRDADLSEESDSGRSLGSPVDPIATCSGVAYSEPLGFLIEAARDCLEMLLAHDVSRAESQLAEWTSSGVVLLRRLAIHGWSTRSDTDASTMANWLAAQGLILHYDYQSEVPPLITRILESEDATAIELVVSDILAHASDSDFTPRRAVRTLHWMRRHDVALDAIDAAIDTLTRLHEDLKALVQAADSTPPEQNPLTTAEELALLIESDLPEAVAYLKQFSGQEARDRAFAWYDIQSTVAGVVRQSPGLGFDLLDVIEPSSPLETAIVGPIINGWANAIVDDDLAQRILARISTADTSSAASEVAAMLAGLSGSNDDRTEWNRFATSRQIARECWESLGTGPAEEQDGWFHTAINSSAGQLAIFWIQVVQDHYALASDNWRGLPPDLSATLASMLTCGDGRGDLVEVIFSHEISFLHSIDRSWSAEHVLRLFDWADEHRARRAWSGFLAGGRINDDLLRAGLLQGILQTALRAKSFDKNSRNSLFQLSAQTALRSQLHPRDWVPRLIRNSDVEGRALWADHIGEYLRDLQPQEAEAQWARWLKAYWESRIESVPRRLDLSEASFMAQWIVHLTESAQEGINLVLQRPAGLTPYSRLLGHIDEQTVQRDPGTWAEFVSHLLSNTDLPFYGGYELPNVLRCLETCGADAISLNAIREQALRLGLPLDD